MDDLPTIASKVSTSIPPPSSLVINFSNRNLLLMFPYKWKSSRIIKLFLGWKKADTAGDGGSERGDDVTRVDVTVVDVVVIVVVVVFVSVATTMDDEAEPLVATDPSAFGLGVVGFVS